MHYRSTRGGAQDRVFADILIEGMAPDGGLYVPAMDPGVVAASTDFASTVAAVVERFVEPDPIASDLAALTSEIYGRFSHPEVAPVRDMGDGRHLLELFWGPTFSFKDYALQLVGALFDRVLERSGERILVLGATSGDTGSAAIEACRGRDGIDIVILYPQGAVSEVQRRQMTTVPDANVHVVAVKGTFDDCQRLVKHMFANTPTSTRLAAINSINWARIMAQAAYYVHVAGRFTEPIDIVVPTGNFGNIYSARVASKLGADIARLTAANNTNHGLSDLVGSGWLSVGEVIPTLAPAMDIQVPSNLERHIFDIVDHDASRVTAIQSRLAESGRIQLSEGEHARLATSIRTEWRSDDDILATIRGLYERTGVLVDPHTAVAWAVSEDRSSERPTVVVSTAHPAKFGEAVREAVGFEPPLPAALAEAMVSTERTTTIPPDPHTLATLLTTIAP